MRKLVYSISLSLDGYIDSGAGDASWVVPDEELRRHFNDVEREIESSCTVAEVAQLKAQPGGSSGIGALSSPQPWTVSAPVGNNVPSSFSRARGAQVNRQPPQDMNSVHRIIAVIASGVLLYVASVLLGIYPYRPASPWAWVGLFVAAMPIAIFYALIGERLFSPELRMRLNIPLRVAYGSVVALTVLFVSWVLLDFMRPHLTTRGV
jgi:hypothetical protein